MKTHVIVALVSVLLALIVGFVGFSLYQSSLPTPSDSYEKQDEPPVSPINFGDLKINRLTAYSNGNVSFEVTFQNGDSIIIEAVIINGTSYPWSEGSSENSTILKEQTKRWCTNVGSLTSDAKIEVALQTSLEKVNAYATVCRVPSSDAPNVPDEPDFPNSPIYYYDYYSGVNSFDRGVYFVATSQDPLTQLPRSDFPKSYWEMMRENVTAAATENDFISILVSRGTFPTGGYTLQIESFSWLESFPVKFRCQINLTDPGEGVAVSQAFTNPSLLMPIGKLTAGEYIVEIHITSYIYTFDSQGKLVYRPIMTFKEEVWTQTLTITAS